jgi:hypothetical protein
MKTAYLTLLLLIHLFAPGQNNIVINNSFEDDYNMDSLRKGRKFQWSFLEDYNTKTDWAHIYRIGSDIFDDAPENGTGYQLAQHGCSYAGFGVYDNRFEFRDYLIGTLNQTLEKDAIYKISFYLNLANCSKYAINSIGVSFSQDIEISRLGKRSFTALSELPVYFEHNGGVLKDTSNWIKIQGEIRAMGHEQKIIIGCFKPDSELIIEKRECKGCRKKDESLRLSSYYLIDNICLERKQ